MGESESMLRTEDPKQVIRSEIIIVHTLAPTDLQ